MKIPVSRSRRPLLSVLCLVLVILFLYDWQHRKPNNDGTWDRVQQTGVLRIGMDASYPPFSDTPSNTPVGLDVDLANAIGKRLGVRVEIDNMGFDGLYDALRIGRVDALISALSVDPTRLNWVLYTQSYVDAGLVLVSRDGQVKTMSNLDGHVLAVEYGSLGDETARIWERRLHVLKMLRLTTSDEAMQAVQDGKADAALVDFITARLYLKVHPALAISPEYISHTPYAIAVRLVSYDLGGAIGDALKAMDQDGTLAAILNRWL